MREAFLWLLARRPDGPAPSLPACSPEPFELLAYAAPSPVRAPRPRLVKRERQAPEAWRRGTWQPAATLAFELTPPDATPRDLRAPLPAPSLPPASPPMFKRVLRSPRWDFCVACDCAFSEARPPKRWYGLCLPCYRSTTQDERAFYNNVTQRWRKAALRQFGKHDADALPVWEATPSPIQVMLLRLAHAFGLTTPPGCEGTLCEGLDRRLGCSASDVDAAIRGWGELTPEARRRLIDGALDWLAADEAHCLAMAEEYPEDEDEVDPDDPDVLRVAAELRRELGRTT